MKYINDEQIHQMQVHRWIESQREGHDLGEAGNIDWVSKYAGAFREWVEHVPSQCIHCGLTGCQGPDEDGDCQNPFSEHRLNILKSRPPQIIPMQ